jgi:hypothetical protein
MEEHPAWYLCDIPLAFGFGRNCDDSPNCTVPRRFTYHSPDGFEWGYGGSGPSDLAWNLLSLFLGKNEASLHYQKFKRAFIEPMSHDGGVITKFQVLAWLSSEGIHIEIPTKT